MLLWVHNDESAGHNQGVVHVSNVKEVAAALFGKIIQLGHEEEEEDNEHDCIEVVGGVSQLVGIGGVGLGWVKQIG